MANYCCAVRTNYFRVTDQEKFKNVIDKAVATDDVIRIFDKEINGELHFAFGCYGTINGIPVYDPETDDYFSDDFSYDNFVRELQNVLHPDDAIIIFEAGNEKLRYVIGCAHIITKDRDEYLNLAEIALDKTRYLLGNEKYKPDCAY